MWIGLARVSLSTGFLHGFFECGSRPLYILCSDDRGADSDMIGAGGDNFRNGRV
jgi:hypothetical protein